MDKENRKFKEIKMIDLNGQENKILMPHYSNGNELLIDLEDMYSMEFETEDYETFYEKENVSIFEKEEAYFNKEKPLPLSTVKIENKLDSVIKNIEDNNKLEIDVMNLHTEYFKNIFEIMERNSGSNIKQNLESINIVLEDMVDDEGNINIKKNNNIMNLIFNIINSIVLIGLFLYFILGF